MRSQKSNSNVSYRLMRSLDLLPSPVISWSPRLRTAKMANWIWNTKRLV